MIRIAGEWRRVPLEALGVWQGGSTPSKKVPAFWKNGTVPWISPKDFGPPRISSSQDKITKQALANGGASSIEAGSLIIVTRSGILKHSLPLAVTEVVASINQDVKALTPAPSVNPDFLRYQLCSRANDLLGEAVRRGTTVQSLDDKKLRSFAVVLPMPQEQERIVRWLDSFSSSLAGLEADVEAALAKTETLKETLLQAAFTGDLTAPWRLRRGDAGGRPTVRVADVVESLRYGSSRKSSRRGDLPVLRMGNIQDGRLDWSDLVYTSDPTEIAKHLLAPGDVLFNRTNSPELVGKTAVYSGERAAIAAGYLIVARCSPGLRPAFLAHLLNSPAGRAYSWSVKSDGVSQSNINARKLANFRFGLPSIDEQDEILRLLEIGLSEAAAVRAALEGAEAAIRRLRARALEQAFDPEEPEAVGGLTGLLADIDQFKAAFSSAKAGRSRRRMNVDTIGREVESALRAVGPKGLAFERIAETIGADYESLRGAVFHLLIEKRGSFRQYFDEATGGMRLECVGP